ncbi:MAG: site-specific integrase [Clostridia bacterium]|nr:site-specific integrase [Clostridia bacterium]
MKDQALLIILNAAADGVKLKSLQNQSKGILANKTGNLTGGKIQFTMKEIFEMPENVKRLFIINERAVNYRIVRGMYQIRYHRDGYNIDVASKDLAVVKKKFLDALAKGATPLPKKSKYPLFREFAQKWLDYKKPTIKEKTLHNYTMIVDRDINPSIGDMRIDEIKREDLQNLLNKMVENGKQGSAQLCKTMLGSMFDLAVEDYDIKNPTAKVVLPHYEEKRGSALTKDEERNLLKYCRENPKKKNLMSAIIILLYTGMRVGEFKTMTHDDKFIYCISEKTRKGYLDVKRKIPISPMLKKVIDMVDFDAKELKEPAIAYAFKVILPNHHVHELRYTFITRAKECGINPEVVMLMDGHKQDHDVLTSRIDRGYTDYSDEYLLKEMQKFDYEL